MNPSGIACLSVYLGRAALDSKAWNLRSAFALTNIFALSCQADSPSPKMERPPLSASLSNCVPLTSSGTGAALIPRCVLEAQSIATSRDGSRRQLYSTLLTGPAT